MQDLCACRAVHITGSIPTPTSFNLLTHHSACVTSHGNVFCWGWNSQGQLGELHSVLGLDKIFTFVSGIECIKDSTIPAIVASLDGIRIRSIACGRQHTIAVAENGSLYAWGKNSNGQCGLGHTNNILSPVCVSSLLQADVRVHVAAAGAAHTICISEAGVLFSFGRGDEGQLGLGDDGGFFAY